MTQDPRTVDDLLNDIASGNQGAKGQLLTHMVDLAQREYRRGRNEMRRKVLDSIIEEES